MAALFYSLSESAKLAGVEPRAYLGEAARATSGRICWRAWDSARGLWGRRRRPRGGEPSRFGEQAFT